MTLLYNRVNHFFKRGITSQAGIFIPPDGYTREIDVIFDNEYQSVSLHNLEISNSGPVAICKEVDIPEVDEDCRITIDGTEYRIKSIKPDKKGLVELELTKYVA